MAKNQIIYTLFDEKVILVLDMAIFCRSLSFLSFLAGGFQFVVERGEGIVVEVVEGNTHVTFYMVGIKDDFVEAGVEDAVGKHVLHVKYARYLLVLAGAWCCFFAVCRWPMPYPSVHVIPTVQLGVCRTGWQMQLSMSSGQINFAPCASCLSCWDIWLSLWGLWA